MSIRPVFTTAPRIKLRIGDVTIGYAIGFNVSLSISQEPVYVVGEYGPITIEPTMYNIVTGAMQIVRLRSKDALQAGLNANPGSSAPVASSTNFVKISNQAEQTTNSILNQQNLFRMLDPALVLLTQSFDVDIYLRVPVKDALESVDKNKNVAPNTINVNTLASNVEQNGVLEEVKLMTVKDVRITGRNTNISMGALINEPLTFQGLMLLRNDENGIAQDSAIFDK